MNILIDFSYRLTKDDNVVEFLGFNYYFCSVYAIVLLMKHHVMHGRLAQKQVQIQVKCSITSIDKLCFIIIF